MRRLLLLFTAVLILLVLVSGAGAALAWAALGEDYADHEGPVVLDYTRGMTGESLAVVLEDRGVVRSRWLFQLVRALNPDAVLQAGEYEFTAPVSPREVFQKLADFEEYWSFAKSKGFFFTDICEIWMVVSLRMRSSTDRIEI